MSKFLNFNFVGYGKKSANVLNAAEKLRKRKLSIEQILNEDDLINDINLQSNSALSELLKVEDLKCLIDYIIREPKEDDYDFGHRFPFLACEILSRENMVIVEKMFQSKKENEKDQDLNKAFINSDSVSSENNSNDSNKSKYEANLFTKKFKKSSSKKEIFKSSETLADLRKIESKNNDNKKIYDSLDVMSLDQLNKFLEEDKIEKNIQPDLPIDQKIPANEACEGKNNSEVSDGKACLEAPKSVEIKSDIEQESLLSNFNNLFKTLKKSHSVKDNLIKKPWNPITSTLNRKNKILLDKNRNYNSTLNKSTSDLNKSLEYSFDDISQDKSEENNTYNSLKVFRDKAQDKAFTSDIKMINFSKSFEKLKNGKSPKNIQINNDDDSNFSKNKFVKQMKENSSQLEIVEDLNSKIINQKAEEENKNENSNFKDITNNEMIVKDNNPNEESKGKNKQDEFNIISNLNDLLISSDEESLETFDDKDLIKIKNEGNSKSCILISDIKKQKINSSLFIKKENDSQKNKINNENENENNLKHIPSNDIFLTQNNTSNAKKTDVLEMTDNINKEEKQVELNFKDSENDIIEEGKGKNCINADANTNNDIILLAENINNQNKSNEEELKTNYRSSSIVDQRANDKADEFKRNDCSEASNRDLNKSTNSSDKKKETIEYELIDHLLTFLDSDEPLNYILSGYFSKVLLSLKYSKPYLLINYLMKEKRQYIDRMIHHFNRKAIADCLLKLISSESDISLQFSIQEELNFKVELIILLTSRLTIFIDDDEKIDNINDFLSEILKEKKLFHHMAEKNIFNNIFDFLLVELEKYRQGEQSQGSAVDLEKSKYFKTLNNIIFILSRISEYIVNELNFYLSLNKNELLMKLKQNNEQDTFNGSYMDPTDKSYINEYSDSNFDNKFFIEKTLEICKDKKPDILDLEFYTKIFSIYEKVLPLLIQTYCDLDKRQKKKLGTTYSDAEIEIFGVFNLSILELLKNFFELINLNSKAKAFGYEKDATKRSKKVNLDDNPQHLDYFEYSDLLKRIFICFSECDLFRILFLDLKKFPMNNCLQLLFKTILFELLEFCFNNLANFSVHSDSKNNENKIKDKNNSQRQSPTQSNNNLISDNSKLYENIDKILEENYQLSENSIYFMKAIEINQTFIKYFFSEINILDKIICLALENGFEFENSKSTINVGYLPCMIEIADKINLVKTQDKMLEEIINTHPKWNIFMTIFCNPINNLFKKAFLLDESLLNVQRMQYKKYSTFLSCTKTDINNEGNQKKDKFNLNSKKENFIQLLRKKAKYSLITNEFHIENYLGLENYINFSDFKKLSPQKTYFYDNQYWINNPSNLSISSIDETTLLKDLLD